MARNATSAPPGSRVAAAKDSRNRVVKEAKMLI
jgi:hypothetical protein